MVVRMRDRIGFSFARNGAVVAVVAARLARLALEPIAERKDAALRKRTQCASPA
jgi:hypothetical protein